MKGKVGKLEGVFRIKHMDIDNGYINYVLKICNPIVLHLYKKPSKARSFYVIYYIDIKFSRI